MAELMRDKLPIIGTAFIFLFIQFAALSLAPLCPTEYQAFEDADNPVNPLFYIVMILIITGIVLILIKYGKGRIIQAIFLTSVFITIFIMFIPLIYLVFPSVNAALLGSLAMAVAMVLALIIHPEWYVVDIVGITVAAGVTAILGMSLGILPAMIFLIVLAVYDAISVYKTKHMLTLAEGVSPLGLPVLFVVPKKGGFKMASLKGKSITAEGEEREAVFMGLGDSVIPGILVVSAFMFLPSSSGSIDFANLIVALGTVIGSFIGYLLLMRLVYKGKPQAGLPLLNGGALLGFALSYIIVFQDLGLGIL
jgi:presenilin-like A22 family membrane protease